VGVASRGASHDIAHDEGSNEIDSRQQYQCDERYNDQRNVWADEWPQPKKQARIADAANRSFVVECPKSR
jgi:hypothetical protein